MGYEELEEQQDSRERINADASELVADYARNGSVCDALYNGILGLLDRQAALTERETSHDNPYVGLVRGKQWERTEMSDYYCGRCGWKVTDHDSYCPECGGALHRAANKPDGKFDAPKTADTPETDTSKGDIRDFDDTCEKQQAELDRQAALTEREWDSATANRRIVELQAKLAQCMESYADARDSRDVLRAERDELRARLDAYDQTHMLLPVDADGVPCRIGDELRSDPDKLADACNTGGIVTGVANGTVFLDRGCIPLRAGALHHVNPRTVESVLSEFASRVLNSGHQWGLDAHDVVAEYAAELRELTGGVQ